MEDIIVVGYLTWQPGAELNIKLLETGFPLQAHQWK